MHLQWLNRKHWSVWEVRREFEAMATSFHEATPPSEHIRRRQHLFCFSSAIQSQIALLTHVCRVRNMQKEIETTKKYWRKLAFVEEIVSCIFCLKMLLLCKSFFPGVPVEAALAPRSLQPLYERHTNRFWQTMTSDGSTENVCLFIRITVHMSLSFLNLISRVIRIWGLAAAAAAGDSLVFGFYQEKDTDDSLQIRLRHHTNKWICSPSHQPLIVFHRAKCNL